MKENLGHLEQNFGLKMRFLWGFVRGLWLIDTDLNGRFLLRKVAKGQGNRGTKGNEISNNQHPMTMSRPVIGCHI